MKLLTKAIEKKLPEPLSTDGQGDAAIAQVKFFCPWNQWTWYATEYDPQDRIFFGLVVGFETELGSFSLDELESVRGMFGLGIERDTSFRPTTLTECRRSHA